jgi:hypothetical protein
MKALWSSRHAATARLAAYLALLVVAFGAGFVSALAEYPRGEFARTWAKIADERGANAWGHVRELSDDTSRLIVRPNNDTLYSYAAVDLAEGPQMIEVPASDRYWSVEFMRDNTDVFAYVGSRGLGLGRPARVLLAPASFSADSQGLEVIRAPSARVWLLARFLVDGSDDLPRVHQLQGGLRISRWKGG